MSEYAYIREEDNKVFHVEKTGETVIYLRSADGTEEDTLYLHSNEKNEAYRKVEMVCPYRTNFVVDTCKGPLASEGSYCCDYCADEYYEMVKCGTIEDYIP